MSRVGERVNVVGVELRADDINARFFALKLDDCSTAVCTYHSSKVKQTARLNGTNGLVEFVLELHDPHVDIQGEDEFVATYGEPYRPTE